jgi:hypothetical protein
MVISACVSEKQGDQADAYAIDTAVLELDAKTPEIFSVKRRTIWILETLFRRLVGSYHTYNCRSTEAMFEDRAMGKFASEIRQIEHRYANAGVGYSDRQSIVFWESIEMFHTHMTGGAYAMNDPESWKALLDRVMMLHRLMLSPSNYAQPSTANMFMSFIIGMRPILYIGKVLGISRWCKMCDRVQEFETKFDGLIKQYRGDLLDMNDMFGDMEL